ncbi:hypothetical protein V6Z12_A02G111500 [Gossypium hirsutum]
MGDVFYVIGNNIHRDKHHSILGLSQETYINKGDKFNLNQCSKNEFEREKMKNIQYTSIIRNLIYAQSNPGINHWKAAKNVLRYFKGTKNYMLTYKQLDNLEVIGYSGSDFFEFVDSRKSTSGYIFMFVGGAISWRSVKQTLTTTSTMKVEFISCFKATSHGVWLKSSIFGLRLIDSISRLLMIYYDNSAIVFMAKNNKSGSRSKHINIKYLAIREHVKEKKAIIQHINT